MPNYEKFPDDKPQAVLQQYHPFEPLTNGRSATALAYYSLVHRNRLRILRHSAVQMHSAADARHAVGAVAVDGVLR